MSEPIIVVMDEAEFAITMMALSELGVSIDDGRVTSALLPALETLYQKMLVCYTDAGYTVPRGAE
jgi:hypothetical protein